MKNRQGIQRFCQPRFSTCTSVDLQFGQAIIAPSREMFHLVRFISLIVFYTFPVASTVRAGGFAVNESLYCR